MKHLFKQFAMEEEGSVVEYILILAVVAIVLFLVFPTLRTAIASWFNEMIEDVTTGIGSGQTQSDINSER